MKSKYETLHPTLRCEFLADLDYIPMVVREGREHGKSGQFHRLHAKSLIDCKARGIAEDLKRFLDDGSLTAEEHREFVQMLQDACKKAYNA